MKLSNFSNSRSEIVKKAADYELEKAGIKRGKKVVAVRAPRIKHQSE